MIRMTDNLYEFRKFVLKNLIKEGYKYIARDKELYEQGEAVHVLLV